MHSNIIINCICNHSLLTIPDLSDEYYLFTNASVCGVGVVLCVCRNDVWVPCAFYSRQLNDCERSYSDTELEALALLVIIKHLLICFLQQFYTIDFGGGAFIGLTVSLKSCMLL